MAILKRLKHGAKLRDISAGTWNAFVDATEWVRKHQAGLNLPHQREYRDGNVQAANGDSVLFSQFDIVGLSSILYSSGNEFKNNYAFNAATYSDATHGEKWGILQAPLHFSGSAGRPLAPVKVAGTSVVRIDMRESTHKFAKPKNDEKDHLESHETGGVPILWVESGTGVKNAVVVLDRTGAGTSPIKYVRLTGTLHPGYATTGVFVEYDWDTLDWVNESEEDPPPEVTVTDYPEALDASSAEADAELVSGHNFGLEGEVLPVRWDTTFATGEDTEDSGFSLQFPDNMFPDGMFGLEGELNWESGAWVVVGSHGLTRYAKPKSDSPGATGIAIAPGEWKDVVIYHKGTAGGEDEPIVTDPEVTVKAMPLKWEWGTRRGVKHGDKIVVRFQPDQGRWTIEPNDEDIQRFKLTAQLSIGGSAAAVFMDWNGSTWAEAADTLTVYDSMSILCSALASGKKGHCKHYRDSNRWELI